MSTPIGLRPVQNYEIDTDYMQPGDVYLLEIDEDSFDEIFCDDSKDICLYQKHMYAICVDIYHDHVKFFSYVKKYKTTISGEPIEDLVIELRNLEVSVSELENGNVAIIERIAQSQADREAERIKRITALPECNALQPVTDGCPGPVYIDS